MNREVWWLAVFEQVTSVDVPQKAEIPGLDGPRTIQQAVSQKWSRSGRAQVGASQTTEDVVTNIVKGCKESTGVPEDALLINLVMLPNQFFGNVE
jgi:hypothetical protein